MAQQRIMMTNHERTPVATRRTAGTGTGSGTARRPAVLRLAPLCALAACLLFPGAAAAGIEAALGDTVSLSGYSYGSTAVYLFLTGPNLPSGGVSLDDLMTPADAGGLTRVRTDDQHRWSYDWDTTAGGQVLDAGTYTIWVTTEPAGRAGLRGGDFRTLTVTLRSPGLAVAAAAPPAAFGTVSVRSVPQGASVTFDGNARGTAPLEIRDVTPGIHTAALTLAGYRTVSVDVTVEPGRTAEVNVTLVPHIGTIAVATDPPGAGILLDGRAAGVSPVVLVGVPAGTHTITALLDGFAQVDEPVDVPASGTVNVSLSLPRSGETAAPAATRAGTSLPLLPAAAAVLGMAIVLSLRR